MYHPKLKGLVVCQHGNRRVVLVRDGVTYVLADKYHGKRLNSPNDVTMLPDGSIFFTDPPYGQFFEAQANAVGPGLLAST